MAGSAGGGGGGGAPPEELVPEQLAAPPEELVPEQLADELPPLRDISDIPAINSMAWE